MITTYTGLHNHTEYSNLKLIDSINITEKLIDYAFELGMGGIAITDHDTLSGHVRAWNYYNQHFSDEQKANFKLILGNEIYLCRSDLTAETHQKGEKFYHLILLAKDDIGHEQIRQISARAWSRSYMKNITRTPTYSEDLLDIIGSNPGHVIASTACLGGYPANKFAEGDYAAIDKHLEAMSGLFGEGNFCVELQPSHQQEQIDYNKFMVERYWGYYPFIVTTDAHYLKKEDLEIQRVFLNSKSSGDREVDTFYSAAYVMSAEEVREYLDYLPSDVIDTMFENTNRIRDKVVGYNLQRTSIIPKVLYDKPTSIHPFIADLVTKYPTLTTHLAEVIAEKNPADLYLLNSLVEPWKERIINAGKDEARYVEELDYEFEQTSAIGHGLGQCMSDYFITMARMIDIMWDQGDSIVGPGRGSAGSSLVNYLLGITQIDPLAQSLELPYWRFLHAQRPGLPD